MKQRIKNLVDYTMSGKMYPNCKKTDYERTDIFLPHIQMSAKRVCEYIKNQEPVLFEDCCFTGQLRFDGSVEGDIFTRCGHENLRKLDEVSYNKPYNNLITFEWQHSTGDFEKIIKYGLHGIMHDIEISTEKHRGNNEAVQFLQTQNDVCKAIISWAHKCSARAEQLAENIANPEHKKNLVMLSQALKKIPEQPAQNFYEAVLCLFICYSFIPDSIGLIDRYLYPYYKKDIEEGIITSETAAAYLQELFLMLQARISIDSNRFYRGGETHFCIGGYLPDGSDGFTDFSKLIVEALMELPTWIPQISLRWTPKTPHEVLRYMLDCERNDPNKRIAFVNDVPRLKGLTKYSGFSYDEAINYSMIGCNEISLPGGIVFGFDPINVARSVTNVFSKRCADIVEANSFDEFFEIYKQELFSDLWEAEHIGKCMQDVRSRDCNIVSNIFMTGSIENAKSVTQGGASKYTAVGLLIGITTVIDSLSIVKQFVYDDKNVTMKQLIEAISSNWEGYEDLHSQILKIGHFFGNDDECSNGVARRFTNALVEWNNDKNYLRKKWVFGNLIGYNEHHKFFGDHTGATPDGRYCGDMISFGLGQNNGKDREGLTALLNSVAKCDPNAVLTGPSVTNIMLDEQLIRNEVSFEKLVYLFETYFKMGGTHFQLSYVSIDDLKNAQITPDKYRNLRVRVSGFSDYFVLLNKGLQDEIITRTTHND